MPSSAFKSGTFPPSSPFRLRGNSEPVDGEGVTFWKHNPGRLAAIFCLVGVLALAAGCGVDNPPLVGLRTPVTTLFGERTFRQGDVEVVEAITLTSADQSQVFHLRARLTNLGVDLPGARYELVFQRKKDVFQEIPSRLPTPTPVPITLTEPVVKATQILGTLFAGQSTTISLSAKEYGSTRIQASGRLTLTP
jgi:hypothetical protein